MNKYFDLETSTPSIGFVWLTCLPLVLYDALFAPLSVDACIQVNFPPLWSHLNAHAKEAIVQLADFVIQLHPRPIGEVDDELLCCWKVN